MKIRFLRTCAAQGQHYEAGQIADLPDKVGRELVSLRRAEVLNPIIETRDPVIAIGDAADTVIISKGKKSRMI